MSSYAKSLLALGIALIAVICAAFWLRSRVIAFDDLSRTRDAMKTQIAGIPRDAALIAAYEKRMEVLRRDIKQITDKFVGKDYETPQLVKGVVKSASLSGMEMINASRLERQAGAPTLTLHTGRGPAVNVILHEIILKGSYPGLVKFLQSMAAWEMGAKIESMEITPDATGAAPDEINVTLRLSVFALAQ